MTSNLTSKGNTKVSQRLKPYSNKGKKMFVLHSSTNQPHGAAQENHPIHHLATQIAGQQHLIHPVKWNNIKG